MSQRQPLTILFADVSGSTKLFETLGDVAARRIVSGVLQVLAEITQRHGGRLIKTIGDEVMCTFPGALNGLLAATDMQKRVSTDPIFSRDNLGIRVGLHHGDTLVEEADVYGDAVNTAARMASLAKREQIVTTASTVNGVTNTGPLRTRSLGTARVSGKLQPIEIVDVMWQDDTSNVTTVQRVVKLVEAQQRKARLLLRFRGQAIELDELAPPFSLGREATNNLMVDAEWVSRTHATIEYKRGYWVIGDRSTNGTWVRLGEAEELRLHRDEIQLRSRAGTISLGQETSLNPDYVLQFQCIEA
jgi:class 3 adenylate cyclase